MRKATDLPLYLADQLRKITDHNILERLILPRSNLNFDRESKNPRPYFLVSTGEELTITRHKSPVALNMSNTGKAWEFYCAVATGPSYPHGALMTPSANARNTVFRLWHGGEDFTAGPPEIKRQLNSNRLKRKSSYEADTRKETSKRQHPPATEETDVLSDQDYPGYPITDDLPRSMKTRSQAELGTPNIKFNTSNLPLAVEIPSIPFPLNTQGQREAARKAPSPTDISEYEQAPEHCEVPASVAETRHTPT